MPAALELLYDLIRLDTSVALWTEHKWKEEWGEVLPTPQFHYRCQSFGIGNAFSQSRMDQAQSHPDWRWPLLLNVAQVGHGYDCDL